MYSRVLSSSEIQTLYNFPHRLITPVSMQVGVAGAPPTGNPAMYYQQMAMGAA
jgi:hypothetical protein